ncbi:hypothetical protein BS50DRAFT_144254 [Corynespora cassiicola Philippines]|uniref:Uncharacterized protein n=1 Tax=Corynespora cassiicola Philippines TaxID=1448308 RepID=A0A2T2N889_CORCC|nr:hypothetical protein BS50DRAFT_144254 [Corynespora cassiicola Philippines]
MAPVRDSQTGPTGQAGQPGAGLAQRNPPKRAQTFHVCFAPCWTFARSSLDGHRMGAGRPFGRLVGRVGSAGRVCAQETTGTACTVCVRVCTSCVARLDSSTRPPEETYRRHPPTQYSGAASCPPPPRQPRAQSQRQPAPSTGCASAHARRTAHCLPLASLCEAPRPRRRRRRRPRPRPQLQHRKLNSVPCRCPTTALPDAVLPR